MDLGIEGKVALVTGGSRGLGKQAAMSLAKEGVHVVICARTESTLNETVEDIRKMGGHISGFVAKNFLFYRGHFELPTTLTIR